MNVAVPANRYKVISQNEYPDSRCSGRANQNVPFGQKRITLQASFYCLHRGLAQRYPFCVDSATQFHHWLDSFPRHALGPLEHRRHIDELGSIPMQFQNPPTALNRIILAVIGGIIEELDRLADDFDQLH